MIETTYDLGIVISILFLLSVYITTLSIVGYTTATNLLFKCDKWIFIPKFVTEYLYCVWDKCLDRRKADVFLSMVVLGFAIVPFSLGWIITYPAAIYFMIRYRSYNRDALSSSS